MGNTVVCRRMDAAVKEAGKVVLSDGRVQNLEEVTTVAEVMLEHPQHVVVEFDPSSVSFTDRSRQNFREGKMVKKKLTPLPADKTLEPGKIYLVLPAKRIGDVKSSSSAVMTSEEMRRMISGATTMVKSSFSYYEGILPWFTTRGFSTPAASSAVVSATPVVRLEAEKEKEKEKEVDMEEEIRPEFLSRQLSGRGWKPSLDPIKEKKPKKKIYQRLLL